MYVCYHCWLALRVPVQLVLNFQRAQLLVIVKVGVRNVDRTPCCLSLLLGFAVLCPLLFHLRVRSCHRLRCVQLVLQWRYQWTA